jgi:hypothetical protein
LQALGLGRRRENQPLLLGFAGAPNLAVRRAAQEALAQLQPTRDTSDTSDGATWMEDEDTLPCGLSIVDGRLVS